MDRSQLRELASGYAQGQIQRKEYRARRRHLIDGIVAGEITIRREPPVDVKPPVAPPKPEVVATSTVSRTRTPALVAAAGLGILLAGLLTWLLFSGGPETNTRESRMVQLEPSPGRTLIEGFLADADWTDARISRFRDQWVRLSPDEREATRSTQWYERLTAELRQEINAQRALAEFDTTGTAEETGRRLSAFARALDEVGGAEAMPDDPRAPQTPGDDRTTGSARDVTATVPDAVAGNHWLRIQDDSAFSLQLFAVNRLDRVARLFANQPELGLKVVAVADPQAKYRVLYGLFDSKDEAHRALRQLPLSVLQEAPAPLAKSVATMKADLVQDTAPTVTRRPLPYTLQLYAMSELENVDKLLEAYPSLDLKIQRAGGEPARYRVTYGAFASPEEASRAFYALPDGILGEARKPVVKSFDALGGPATP